MTPWAHLKSVACLSVVTLSLSIWTSLLVVVAIVKLAIFPARGWADRVMGRLYRAAVSVNDFWFERMNRMTWTRPALDLSPDETLIVLSNHSSWSDIFLVQSLIVREGPLLTFLVKRELIWVPLLGPIFWALDFPLLRRHARGGGSNLLRRQRDFEALMAACEVIGDRPTALMNFAEGTRFSAAKRESLKSPYEHLLRPKVGGLSAMLGGLGERVDAVIDVTLICDPPVSFWGFLSGGRTKITVEAERIPIAQVPRSRDELEVWVEERWQKKDERIAAVRGGAA